MRYGHDSRLRGRFRVRNSYKTPMAVMLICPKCQADTELRGTMDAYYLTWCASASGCGGSRCGRWSTPTSRSGRCPGLLRAELVEGDRRARPRASARRRPGSPRSPAAPPSPRALLSSGPAAMPLRVSVEHRVEVVAEAQHGLAIDGQRQPFLRSARRCRSCRPACPCRPSRESSSSSESTRPRRDRRADAARGTAGRPCGRRGRARSG